MWIGRSRNRPGLIKPCSDEFRSNRPIRVIGHVLPAMRESSYAVHTSSSTATRTGSESLYEPGGSVRRSDIAWLECQRCQRDCIIPLCLLASRVAPVEGIDGARPDHVALVYDGASAILVTAHGDDVSADIGVDDRQEAGVGCFVLLG